MKTYFFVSESNGHLYDTRKAEWSAHPLRRDYARVTGDTSISIRAAIRQKYAWPGGYELLAFTSDGGCLCMSCCRGNYRRVAWSRRYNCHDGWLVQGIDAAYNYDGPLVCDHCGRVLVEGEEE